MKKIHRNILIACILSIGIIIAGSNFVKEKDSQEVIQQTDDAQMQDEEEIAKNEKDEIVMEEEGKMDKKETIVKSADIQIPTDFTARLLLYEYIEYGLRKYSEENHLNDRYFCDVEENILPYDTELCMSSTSEESFKTDLSKEIIPELSNNLYKYELIGDNQSIYMSIDTYNMKIYVYDDLAGKER